MFQTLRDGSEALQPGVTHLVLDHALPVSLPPSVTHVTMNFDREVCDLFPDNLRNLQFERLLSESSVRSLTIRLLDDAVAVPFLCFIQNCSLTELSFNYGLQSTEQLRFFCHLLPQQPLERLVLEGFSLNDPDDVEVFASCLPASLRCLSLRACGLNKEGMPFLVPALSALSLLELDLSLNNNWWSDDLVDWVPATVRKLRLEPFAPRYGFRQNAWRYMQHVADLELNFITVSRDWFFPALTHLTVNDCPVPDWSAFKRSHVESLCIKQWFELSDAYMLSLSRSLPTTLLELRIEHCFFESIQGLRVLCDHLIGTGVRQFHVTTGVAEYTPFCELLRSNQLTHLSIGKSVRGVVKPEDIDAFALGLRGCSALVSLDLHLMALKSQVLIDVLRVIETLSLETLVLRGFAFSDMDVSSDVFAQLVHTVFAMRSLRSVTLDVNLTPFQIDCLLNEISGDAGCRLHVSLPRFALHGRFAQHGRVRPPLQHKAPYVRVCTDYDWVPFATDEWMAANVEPALRGLALPEGLCQLIQDFVV